MAEGGGFENPAYDPDPFDEQHDNDNDDEYEEDHDETHPFVPGYASTPGPGGEKIPMQTTMSNEQSGLPEVSYTETSFGGDTQSGDAKAWVAAKEQFPNMSSSELEISYNPKNGRLQVKMFGDGKKLYYIFTEQGKRGSGVKNLNLSLTKEIKNALGKSIFQIKEDVKQQQAEIQKQEKEKEKELKQAESVVEETEKIETVMEEKRNEMRRMDEQIDDLEKTHGQLDTEAIKKLKKEKKAIEKEHQESRKELEKARKKQNRPKK